MSFWPHGNPATTGTVTGTTTPMVSYVYCPTCSYYYVPTAPHVCMASVSVVDVLTRIEKALQRIADGIDRTK